jgi:hypothetical protein
MKFIRGLDEKIDRNSDTSQWNLFIKLSSNKVLKCWISWVYYYYFALYSQI